MKKQRTRQPWRFTRQFRRHAFGWKSHPAIERVGQAVVEIRRVGRADPLLAAEGAVAFLERVSPALENVDSSSGAIGSAVNRAIENLVPIIASAPADAATREAWLDRLWEACQQDQIPYIESLGEHWGELCAVPEIAGAWADRLVDLVKLSWSPDPERRGYFAGTTHCLSAMLAAGRHDQLLHLLELDPHPWWTFRQFGVRALAAKGPGRLRVLAQREAEARNSVRVSFCATGGAMNCGSAWRHDEGRRRW